jgi:hypothetical protein
LEVRLRWSNGVFVLDTQPGGLDKLAGNTKAEQVFLNLLAEFRRQDRDVSSKVSNTYAPAVFAKHPDAGGVTMKTLEAAMERLFRDKRITVEPIGPPSRRYSRIVLAER